MQGCRGAGVLACTGAGMLGGRGAGTQGCRGAIDVPTSHPRCGSRTAGPRRSG